MNKPKNRVTFSRRRRTRPQSVSEPVAESTTSNEIPRASKAEIRACIEEDGATSTTEIANRLNEDRLPCASAERWTAALVDSALRRQDMEGLREAMKENRGEDDEQSKFSRLEIRQAAYDGTIDAFKSEKNTYAIKGVVADSMNQVLGGFKRQLEEANESTATTIADQVRAGVQKGLQEHPDLISVRRVSDKTGENVGKVLTKIDDTCTELHDIVVDTLKEHVTTTTEASENLAAQLSDEVDKRFDSLVTKLTSDEKFDLGRVVDARLKAHLDEVVNRFAIMIDGLKRELTGATRNKGRR